MKMISGEKKIAYWFFFLQHHYIPVRFYTPIKLQKNAFNSYNYT